MKIIHTFLMVALFVCPFLTTGCDNTASSSNPASSDANLRDAEPFSDEGLPPDGAVADAMADAETPTVPAGRCDGEAPPVSEGICDATPGDGSALFIRGTILGPAGPLEQGGLLVSGTEIVCVGCDCGEHPDYESATKIECGAAVISPGLINPHDHITFTEGSPIDHGETRYDHRHEWRRALSTPQNDHGTGATSSGVRWGELRMLLSGVTSLVGSGGARGGIRNLDRLSDEERALGFREVKFQTFSLGDANRRFKENCSWDYRYTETEVARFSSFIPHVAEGIDNFAQEEFRCQSTSFDGGQDFTEKNAAHIHSIALTTADYYRMVLDETKLIWSPRSNISLYGVTADVHIFHRLGGTVALGTDWTYSGSANMLRELACADAWNRDLLDGYFTDRALWEMATINAALSTETQAQIGSLEVGKLADIAVFRGGDGASYRAVLEAQNRDVALVLKGGEPLLGERDVVSSLADCEALDICGQAHAICAQQTFGTSFAAIKADVARGRAAYPAIFCDDVPPDEPTCIPSRPGEFTGEATVEDGDGDGVADVDDNCPAVFNPPLPYTGNIQADSDGDGDGDGCDPSPLAEDLDGDMIPNEDDNCPFDANENQSDADTDRRGDVCDFCPEVANPASVCREMPGPDTPISSIQTGAVAEDSRVTLRNVVVTATWDEGIWVQSSEGGPNSGVGVYLGEGGGPSVELGDVIDVIGVVTEYYDDTQIGDAELLPLNMTAAPVVTDTTVAEAMDEQYEGVLVRLTDAMTANRTYDCAQDNDRCSDDFLWEVSGAGASILVFDRTYQGSDWAERIGNTPVTGVMTYRFERRRILPRISSDLPTP